VNTTMPAVSLCEQRGGRESIAAVVEEFFRRTLADDDLRLRFASTDAATPDVIGYNAAGAAGTERGWAMSTESAHATLFAQLGGREVVAAVTAEFYRRVLADDRLNPLFVDLDLDRQERHFAAFLATAFGGPCEYEGRTLRRAHQGLGISLTQFDAAIEHIQSSLVACAVPTPTITAVVRAIAALEDEVVGV
jgi:hemoglobin